MKKIAVFLLSLLCFCHPLLCAENGGVDLNTDGETIEAHAEEPNIYLSLWNMLGTVVLLIAALLILTWFFKRFMQSKIQQMNLSSKIKVLETRAVSTKLSVHLIEVDTKAIVIAESPHGIAKLTEFSSKETDGRRSFQSFLEEKEQ